MTNVDPPDEVPENQKSTWRGDYRDCVNERVGEFEEEREETYRDDLQRSIDGDKHHRELVNLSVFPFVESQPVGYEFLRGDPLSELGVPNFDFLLYDFDGHTIFGEAKASVGDGWQSQCVDEVVEQREVVEEHEEYIVDEYLGGEAIRNKEYVLAVFSPNADNITQEIVSRRENIVTWRVHQMDKQLDVNTTAPPREEWVEDGEDFYELVQHEHNALNTELSRHGSSSECFDLFPESHPVTELRTVISACDKVAGGAFVTSEQLNRSVAEDLYYLSEEKQQEIAESIIALGYDIGYLRDWEDDEGDYKIVSRYTHSDGLEKTLARKWKDHKVEQKKDYLRTECREEVTERILEKSAAQTGLDQFV